MTLFFNLKEYNYNCAGVPELAKGAGEHSAN